MDSGSPWNEERGQGIEQGFRDTAQSEGAAKSEKPSLGFSTCGPGEMLRTYEKKSNRKVGLPASQEEAGEVGTVMGSEDRK